MRGSMVKNMGGGQKAHGKVMLAGNKPHRVACFGCRGCVRVCVMQPLLRAPYVWGVFFGVWGVEEGEGEGEGRGGTALPGCTEEPSAPGAAGSDSRAASATSPPLAASPGRPRLPSPSTPRLYQEGLRVFFWGGTTQTLV